ncbi:MAG: endonuclease [Bacteroidetes bacterium]|nr:endonuclease [Bacteroidota bacterium]
MKRFLLLAAITFCFQFTFSQIPDGYYDSATGTGYTLKTQLHNIIKDHTELSYTPGLWDAYYTTDVDIYYENDGSVLDIYSENPTGADPYNFVLGDDQDDGSNVSEGVHYNREHSFPRNWFGGEVAPMNTDIFHIYPTDKVVNNERSNWPYGEVDSPIWTSANGTKKGPCSYPGYTGTVFEPIDEFKGDIARTYFYMATCYEDVISSWPGSDMLDGSSDQCFTEWALNMLIEWHSNDPVSQKEIDRNNEIYNNYQYNRNPFIDHPEYVAQIWGGSGVFISEVQHSPVSPKSTDVVTVTATITSAGGIITNVDLKWGTSTGNYPNTVTMSSSKGSYTGNIPAQTDGTTVYYMIEASDDNAQSATSSEYDYLVSDNVTTTIFEEDFETSTAESPISINGWTRYEESGTYTWVGKDYNSNKYAQMTAYGTGQISNISWLITPEIDLSNISEATLNFMSKDGYNNGDPVEVFISTDFVGTGNPNAANWTNLNPTLATGSIGGYAASFTESGDVDLTSYCGNTVYIAYKYSGGDPSLTTTMQIDDIVITGTQTMNVAPEISEIENLPISPTEGDDVTVSAKITDSDGTIATAEIKWGTTAGSYTNTVSMTENVDDYSGIIPSQSGGTIVFYVIEATDDDDASTRSSEKEFSFNTPGNSVPEITNIVLTPENPESDDEIVVSATITDSDGTVDTAFVKWRTGTDDYIKAPMTRLDNDLFQGLIPAQPEGTNVYFLIYTTDNDGGSTQTTEQSYVVNIIPEISNINITPTNPESTENVTVSANIEDNDGTIDVAQIKWGTFSGSYTNTETMTNSKGSYSGIIPAQSDNATIYFVVYAEDNNGAAIESSEQSYTVDDPNVLPEITNIVIDPADPESTEDVRVSATIIDSDGRVETATLKWGTSAGNYTTNISMSGTGDSYLGTIPAQADGTEVFFVIVAEDDESATTTSNEQSYIIDDQVNEAPVISEVTYDPTNPTPTDNVVVSCVAEDNDGSVASVLLQWKMGSSAYTDVNMNLSGGKYYGQILPQSNGTTIDFKIIAEDNEGLQGTYEGSYQVSEANGIGDMSEENIRVYPNPAKEFVTVQIDNYNQQLELIIYDVIGSQVYREQVDFNDRHKIYIEDLESGLYFISFAIDKTLVTKKILLKK